MLLVKLPAEFSPAIGQGAVLESGLKKSKCAFFNIARIAALRLQVVCDEFTQCPCRLPRQPRTPPARFVGVDVCIHQPRRSKGVSSHTSQLPSLDTARPRPFGFQDRRPGRLVELFLWTRPAAFCSAQGVGRPGATTTHFVYQNYHSSLGKREGRRKSLHRSEISHVLGKPRPPA